MLMVILAACALRDVLPGPPVMGVKEREVFVVSGHADVTYDGPPLVSFPVLPVQIWGLQYALDVVLVSRHPDWVMHEYARIDAPSGPIWLAKDAGTDGEQTIIAPIEGIEGWAPEVPVRRIHGALDVVDASEKGGADLTFAYTNPLGQAVSVHYKGRLPAAPSWPRNGNTMGHSRGRVAALLDLYQFRIGGKVRMSIGGVPQKLHRLAGIIPEAYLLGQTQCGFAIADFAQEAAASGGFTLLRPVADAEWPTMSREAWTVVGPHVVRQSTLAKLDYAMPNGELTGATVKQTGAGEVMRLALASPLPDVRRHFAGTITAPFVIDVGGRPAHGSGTLAARWQSEDTVLVDMIPTAPRWFAERPMQTRIRYADGKAFVTIAMVPVQAELPRRR